MSFENKILFYSKMTFYLFWNHNLFEIIKYIRNLFQCLILISFVYSSTYIYTPYTCMHKMNLYKEITNKTNLGM